MSSGRLEAFSDGVIAIIITIMVLELATPHDASWSALRHLLPTFLTYMLSFVFLGIYWSNHHHLLSLCGRVKGSILWANLHLLFWLSLTPFVTGWMGESRFAPVPTAVYGVVMLLAAIAYYILQALVLSAYPEDSAVRVALGRNVKGRISPAMYAAAIPLSMVSGFISVAIYVVVALMWLVPDRRIEAIVEAAGAES